MCGYLEEEDSYDYICIKNYSRLNYDGKREGIFEVGKIYYGCFNGDLFYGYDETSAYGFDEASFNNHFMTVEEHRNIEIDKILLFIVYV